MRITFRADASLQIGTGHVMRCLTLADALAAKGADCQFICRAHEGNLLEFIGAKGHGVHTLPVTQSASPDTPVSSADDVGLTLAHGDWLGATQAQDAEDCATILKTFQPDWLIVDHYALDARWERALTPHYDRLMVIDDLADRFHACDLLLDQTFGRVADDYRGWVPADCQLLCGSRYALLRPEFAALRPYSLQRRAQPQVRHLLLAMGGVDKDNATGQVLAALRKCALPGDCEITVVLGSTAPWREEIEQQAREMPWPTQVRIGASDMAQLMADSDLAIGAAGATSWERCCLGLPTIMLVLAANQSAVAQSIERIGAARLIEQGQNIPERLPVLLGSLLASRQELAGMSQAASTIVDGDGVDLVIARMEG